MTDFFKGVLLAAIVGALAAFTYAWMVAVFRVAERLFAWIEREKDPRRLLAGTAAVAAVTLVMLWQLVRMMRALCPLKAYGRDTG